MGDEYIRLDTTIMGIDGLINEAPTGSQARALFGAKDMIYDQQRYVSEMKPAKHGTGGLKMSIDEAIQHCIEVAEDNDLAAGTYDLLAENNHNLYEKLTAESNSKRCTEFAGFNRQLAEWLTELKEAKRLLKAAVEDNKRVLRENFGDICQFCKHYSNSEAQCRKPHNGSGSWCCENAEWRYAAEALKLIGND